MSKLFIGLVTGVFLAFSVQLSAQQPIVVRIAPQQVNVNANQEFDVDVVVENFNGIVSLQFPIEWNPAIIEYVSLSNINATGLPGVTEAANFGVNPGKLSFFWFDQNFVPRSLTNGAKLFTIKFRAKANGSTQVALTNSPPGIEASDANEDLVPVSPQAATVTVGGGGGGGGTVRVAMSQHTVQVGDQVCVQVSATGFTDLIGLQFSVAYNATLLQFNQARSFNGQVPGLTASTVANPSAGVLRFQWNDAASTGRTLPSGAVLFELCFTARAAGAATLSFANTPLQIQATQKVGANPQQNLTVQPANGSVTITEPSTGGGFQLRMNNATAQPGEEICLPVLVNGFQDIVGLQFTVRYDANLLQFVAARNFNAQVPGLGADGITNPSAGVLRFQWNDAGFTGIDLGNGTAIFELCFRARSAGAAQVSFSSNPLAIEVTQKVGADDQEVIDFTTQNATVTIEGNNSGGGPGFVGFGLYMEDQIVNSGDQLCVPVKVQDFKDILGMQFSFKYDPDALQFIEARSFGLPGLSSAGINSPSPGVIALQWDDPGASGQTLADGAVILELCFTVRSPNGRTTTVSFDDRPTPIEFTRKANNSIGQETIEDYNLRNARIIVGDGSQGFDGFGFLMENATPQSGENFCLKVSVQDFQAIVGAQFTIDYDPAVLEYDTIRNPNLPGLGEDAFGNPAPGKITFRWFDPSVAGVTLPDGTVIFEVCFRATGPNGTITLVTFSDDPTQIEGARKVGNTEEPISEVGFKIGKVEIGGGILAIADEPVITNVNCFGQSTGAINIEVRGGTRSYSYQWSYQNRTTQDLTNIPAGTYTVTVTDTGNNQTVTGTYTVTQPQAALTVNAQVQDASCNSGNNPDGSITLTITGGTPQYTIDWGGNLQDGRTSQTGLAPGQYPLTVTDARGCTFNGTPQVRQKASVQAAATPTSINSGNDGAISLAVSGGVTPFTFRWQGPNNFTSTQQNLTGLNTTGEYCVSITDGAGCLTEECVNLFAVLKFANVTVTNACAGENSGSITLQMSGGLAPYTYQWSAGSAGGATLGNLGPGNYSVTVTDAKNDKLNGTFEVTRLSAIVVESVISNVTGEMTNNNGAIRLNVSGGRPGYTIRWNTGATGTQLTNLRTGNYCATVSDQNGCSVNRCFDVAFQAIPLSFEVETTPVRCNGERNGALSFDIIGGSLPYEVTFGDGTRRTTNTGALTLDELPAGRVTFSVKDASGTTLQGDATITQPEPIRVAEAVVVHDTEDPGCSGSIRLSLTGGTPGYSVLWNSPNTGPQIINLCEGPFIPTVADSRGCTVTLEPIQVNTFGVSGEVTNATCLTDENGSVQLSIRGGTTPYTYSWVNEAGEPVSTGAGLEDVRPGRYRVTVTERSGNNLVREFVVGATSNLNVTASVLSNYEGFGVSCPTASDGRLQAQAANGVGALAYEWTRGEEMVGAEATLANARAGVYQVTAIDDSGCAAAVEVELTAPPTIELIPNVTNISCNGSADGEIQVNAAGGAGGNAFTYQWSNGVSGTRINRLRAGSYTVTVTDRYNCSVTRAYEVREPQPLRVNVTTQPATEGCNGQAAAVVTGGTRPYFYRWNSTQTDSLITRLCPGTYVVEVVDSRGCKPQQQSAASGLVGDRRFPCMEASAVITPNDDGDNEFFLINCIEEFPNNTLEVYNRWGQLVYRAQNYDNSWNARGTDGQVVPEGPYYFVLSYVDGNGTAQQLKGAITVIRE